MRKYTEPSLMNVFQNIREGKTRNPKQKELWSNDKKTLESLSGALKSAFWESANTVKDSIESEYDLTPKDFKKGYQYDTYINKRNIIAENTFRQLLRIINNDKLLERIKDTSSPLAAHAQLFFEAKQETSPKTEAVTTPSKSAQPAEPVQS